MDKKYGFSIVAPLVIFSLSCASVNQKISFERFPDSTPISASSALRINDKTVLSDQYESLGDFSFTKTLKAPLVGDQNALVEFNSDLERIKAEKGADAIVDLRFQMTKTDTSDLNWIVLERYTGLFGASILLVVVYSIVLDQLQPESGSTDYQSNNDYMESYWQTLLVPGLVAGGGITLAGFGGSFLHEANGSVKYTYRVDGKAVRLK